MRDGGHDVGFAFDGDGDRVLAVDRNGAVVDGDELIALAALHLRAPAACRARRRGDGDDELRLPHGDGARAGIEVATTPVGDRYVLEALRERGWTLGGEQSGHIIDLASCRRATGSRRRCSTLEALGGGDLAERHAMEKLPQGLVNVRVRRPRRGRGRAPASTRRSSASRPRSRAAAACSCARAAPSRSCA